MKEKSGMLFTYNSKQGMTDRQKINLGYFENTP